MSDAQLIPATIGGFEIMEFGYADAEAPVTMLRREPIVAWQLTAAGTLRPLTASPRAFDLDTDDNVVIAHPNGAVVCRGRPYANLGDWIDERRAQLRRKQIARSRQEATEAARKLLGLVGRDAALGVLERFRPTGFSAPIVKVWDVPEPRLAELRATLAAEIAKHESRVAGQAGVTP